MERVVGITGTPGTGKKSVAPLVAKRLGVECVSLNEVAASIAPSGAPGGEDEVDTVALRRALRKHLGGPAVVYGHLLPYSLTRHQVSTVAVLRCEPGVLKGRLEKRGYAEEKVLANVEAELIGLISADAYRTFGGARTYEVDATYATPPETAELISASPIRRAPRVDWTINYDTGPRLRSLLSP